MPVSYGSESLPPLEEQNTFFANMPCGVFKMSPGQESITFPAYIDQGKDMYLQDSMEFAHLKINFDTFEWGIVDISSTFQNSVNVPISNTEVDIIDGVNSKHATIKVSKLNEGEVFLIKLVCILKDSTIGVVEATTPEDEEDRDPEYEHAVYGYFAVYKGDPINVRHPIFSSHNGKIERNLIYDKPVEALLKSVYLGSTNLFTPSFLTTNIHKETITEYLERFAIEKSGNTVDGSLFTLPKNNTIRSIGDPADQFPDPEEPVGDFGGDIEEVEEVNDDIAQGSIQVASDFAQDELVFYAHGRSIDMDSIRNLMYQHPGNYLGEEEYKPDPELYSDARMNAYRQSPGYNSYIFPLLNPVYIDESVSEPIYFFPGRSSHGGGGGRRVCRNRVRYRRITIGGGYRQRPRQKWVKITRKVCVTIPCSGGPNGSCPNNKKSNPDPKPPRQRRKNKKSPKKDRCRGKYVKSGCKRSYRAKPKCATCMSYKVCTSYGVKKITCLNSKGKRYTKYNWLKDGVQTSALSTHDSIGNKRKNPTYI